MNKPIQTNLIPLLYKKLNSPLPAIIPGADAGILILTTILSTLAYVAVMFVLIKEIAVGFVGIITDVPSFEFAIVDGVETGNFSYLLHSIFAEIALYFFIFVFLIFAILLLLKQAELVTSDTLKNMIKSAGIGIIIIMIFPYLWDSISDISEMSALWVLNPLYSFDEDAPCISSEDPRAAQLADWQRTMKKNSLPVYVTWWDPKEECLPSLRPDYLFSKAIYGATIDLDFVDEEEGDWWNIIDRLTAYTTAIAQGIFGIIFEGVTRATILFFLASMSALVGSVRHLLTDVIAIGLPILLVLRCLPFAGIEKMANTLLTVFVPLLFVPFFSALIITAGSASLLGQEIEVASISGEVTVTNIAADRYLFWMYSIATLCLAVMTPVMFVPMLGSVASMMGKMVMTSTMTGVMGATSAAQGMMQGGAAAFSGLAAGGAAGGIGTMGALKSMFTNPRSMGAVIGGMGSGGMAASRSVLAGNLAGAGKIIPGAGDAKGLIGSSPAAGGADSPAYKQGVAQAESIPPENQATLNSFPNAGGVTPMDSTVSREKQTTLNDFPDKKGMPKAESIVSEGNTNPQEDEHNFSNAPISSAQAKKDSTGAMPKKSGNEESKTK